MTGINVSLSDQVLANELINRLNNLIEDAEVRSLVEALVEYRISALGLEKHPTIQVIEGKVGLLGILNGIVGVIPEGKFKGHGYIAARFDGPTNRLKNFEWTDKTE